MRSIMIASFRIKPVIILTISYAVIIAPVVTASQALCQEKFRQRAAAGKNLFFILKRVVAFFAGTDLYDVLHIVNEYLAIAVMAGV